MMEGLFEENHKIPSPSTVVSEMLLSEGASQVIAVFKGRLVAMQVLFAATAAGALTVAQNMIVCSVEE
jgi:hypothetical protein